MDTIYNKLAIEEGYARVYAASTSNTDEFIDLQRTARANGVGVWSAADGSAPEWRNTDVSNSFHPDVTVVMDRDGNGTVDEIRVNSDEYSGSSATFTLDSRYNTSVEGEVRVEVDGVVNPDAGDYFATETLAVIVLMVR